MESISQVGKQLSEKRKQAEDALRTEFQESLQQLESDLMRLSRDKLNTISQDTDQKLQQIAQDTSEKLIEIGKLHSMELEKVKGRNEEYLKAIHKLHRQNIETEGAKWRKLLYILLPTALIVGTMLGWFMIATQFSRFIMSEEQMRAITNQYLEKRYEITELENGYKLTKKKPKKESK